MSWEVTFGELLDAAAIWEAGTIVSIMGSGWVVDGGGVAFSCGDSDVRFSFSCCRALLRTGGGSTGADMMGCA